jgi:hypothetical protein
MVVAHIVVKTQKNRISHFTKYVKFINFYYYFYLFRDISTYRVYEEKMRQKGFRNLWIYLYWKSISRFIIAKVRSFF